MLPYHDDPLAQADFAVNSVAPTTAAERDLLECLQNLLDYALALDDELDRAEVRAEAAEAELRAEAPTG